MAARKKKQRAPRRAKKTVARKPKARTRAAARTKPAQRKKTAPPRSAARKPRNAAKAPRPAATAKPRRRPARPTRARTAAPSSRRLDDIAETLAVMVPELAARIAALEHVLIEGKVCRNDDLRHARAFIDLRRGGS